MRYGYPVNSGNEVRDLVKAWAAISLMFAIAMNGISFTMGFLTTVIFSGITAGLGFIVHELFHRYTANKLGCEAEFRSFDNMLLIGLLMSLGGFIFAAPGAVVIHGNPGKEKKGKISAAGILGSLIVALFFLLLYIFSPLNILSSVSSYGIYINSWMGLFNLIPFGNFDGRKIFEWSKPVFFALVIFGLVLMLSRGFITENIEIYLN